MLKWGIGAWIIAIACGCGHPSNKPSGPLDSLVILRSNGDFLKAQSAAQSMLTEPFRKIDAGQPLTSADKTNLLRGARLCASMAAYLPGKAPGQDFKCGEALAALGYHEDALFRYRLFEEATGSNPTEPDVRVILADSYGLSSVSLTALGRYKEALDAANAALKAFPNTPAYLVDRAAAESQMGEAAAAKTDAQAAMSAATPDDPARVKADQILRSLTPNKPH